MARTPKTPPIPPHARAVLDRFETRGPVRTRAMFGGHGAWCDGRFVAVVWQDAVYLKVDAATRPLFEAAGATPFRPFAGRPTSLNFYALPERVVGDPGTLDPWIDRALAAATS